MDVGSFIEHERASPRKGIYVCIPRKLPLSDDIETYAVARATSVDSGGIKVWRLFGPSSPH